MSSYRSEKPSAKEEAELIASAKDGDQRAFEALVSSYKRVLDYHVRRYDPPESIVDDLFQEALIGLLKAVRNYDGKSSSFATFASHCIGNSVVSAMRRFNSQSRTNAVPAPDTGEFAPSAEDVTIDGYRAKALYDKIVSSLSDYEKLVFELYLSDVSRESIAFVTGRDVKSIDNAVFRIRKKLRGVITEEPKIV